MQKWRTVKRYLDKLELSSPYQIRRDFAEGFLLERTKKACRNTAIQNIKLFAMVLEEAVRREYIAVNPMRRLGLKRAPSKHKEVWKDEEIQRVAIALEKAPRWMRCTFHFGLYQACRLRQCQVPLEAIDFARNIISYPSSLVKTAADFAQPIDPRFRPVLERLVVEARKAKDAALCEVPWDASLRYRGLFKKLKLTHLCHHGLRATWITRAAIAGVKEAEAMAFVFHSSREIHGVYRRLIAVPTAHVPAAVSFPAIGEFRGVVAEEPEDASTFDCAAA